MQAEFSDATGWAQHGNGRLLSNLLLGPQAADVSNQVFDLIASEGEIGHWRVGIDEPAP